MGADKYGTEPRCMALSDGRQTAVETKDLFSSFSRAQS